MAGLLGVVLVAGDPLAAAYANAGALIQARDEFAAFDAQVAQGTWAPAAANQALPNLAALEAARRAGAADAAAAWYARAPGNATAAERLALLALARGRPAEAETRLAPAAGTQAARLLRADTLMCAGDVDGAFALVQDLYDAPTYFSYLGYERYQYFNNWPRVAASFTIAYRLRPDMTDWKRLADEARGR